MDYGDVIIVRKGRGLVRVKLKQVVGGVSQTVLGVVVDDVNSFLVLAVYTITREKYCKTNALDKDEDNLL